MWLRREPAAFAATLALLVTGFFADSLFGGKVLSPADVLHVSASFRDGRGPLYEPANRLLMDPVLQFEPWLEFNRQMIRRGRLPLWNDYAGCGAPHLANGQSAVFDPINAIAYLGRLPEAYAWMAALRLWLAGFGMYLLARSWNFGTWGRWFCGLAFPFCGFLTVWLLFPVTAVAIWMPWLFWAGERALRERTARSTGVLALITGLVLVGGHIQTAAHVMLAAGLYALWRSAFGARRRLAWKSLSVWSAGIVLGVALASIEIIPLGVYLTKSPVWSDRRESRPSPWQLSKPRLLDAFCTAFPYAFGSQRRGHPHLGRAFGVHNLNESAGGFAGLATLALLAPSAWWSRRRQPRMVFLAGLGAFAACGAFGLPPVDNLLRCVPILDVTDNRRLTLWLAFALILLGGIGLDGLANRRWSRQTAAFAVIASLLLFVGGVGVANREPQLRARARRHYAQSARETPGADPAVYQVRADHQAQLAVTFYPRYFGFAGGQLLVLAALVELLRRTQTPLANRQARLALFALTMIDLIGFGYGLNPAISENDARPETPLIRYLEREVKPPGRILGIGEELPPNILMRYRLNDIRNYDSIELSRNLDWLAALYEPGTRARTSRREVTWAGVLRCRDRLRDASVRAVVAAMPPPPGSFARVDRVGDVWVARLDGEPWASAASGRARIQAQNEHGEIQVSFKMKLEDTMILRETFDPGWTATLDGRSTAVAPYRGAFLAIRVPAGAHRLCVRYDPPEVRLALSLSFFAGLIVVFALTRTRVFRSTRIIARRLGRTQAIELESVLCASPDIHRGMRR